MKKLYRVKKASQFNDKDFDIIEIYAWNYANLLQILFDNKYINSEDEIIDYAIV